MPRFSEIVADTRLRLAHGRLFYRELASRYFEKQVNGRRLTAVIAASSALFFKNAGVVVMSGGRSFGDIFAICASSAARPVLSITRPAGKKYRGGGAFLSYLDISNSWRLIDMMTRCCAV